MRAAAAAYHAVPDRQHAVVQLGAALAVHHAAAVELQTAGGTDGDADGLLGHGLHEGRLVIFRHILVPINGNHIPAPRPTFNASLSLPSQNTAQSLFLALSLQQLRCKATSSYNCQ